jgi:hypothetical protein
MLQSPLTIKAEDLRQASNPNDEGEEPPSRKLAEKMRQAIASMAAVLEHNEECRAGWVGSVGGRLDRGTKIDLEPLLREQDTLWNVIQEGRRRVSSKSSLLDFLIDSQKDIFSWLQDA